MNGIRPPIARASLRAGLLALVAMLSPPLAGTAPAQSVIAAEVSKPVSLPDIAIGSPTAPITIVEYASMSCPHCAAFGENVFPMLRTNYIDTGKVRFVFREFPIDAAAAAASILARCISKDDPEKYLSTIETIFKIQDRLMQDPKETLFFVGKLNGLNEQEVAACESNKEMIGKLSADQQFAINTLKVNSTPTFFINGRMYKGSMPYEDLEALLKPMLKPKN